MSRLARQVRECMSDLEEADGGTLTARFVFPPEFLGFQGHFPGNPVLPAICEIQGAVAMLETRQHKLTELREIIMAKFSAPVTCNEEVVYSCSMTTEDGGGAVVRTTIAKQGRAVAKFRLRVVFQGGTEGC